MDWSHVAYKRSLLILEETHIVVAQSKDICSQFAVKVGPNKRYIYQKLTNQEQIILSVLDHLDK